MFAVRLSYAARSSAPPIPSLVASLVGRGELSGLRSLVISPRVWSSSDRGGLSRFFLLAAFTLVAERPACDVSLQ